jgi:heme A synthase
VKIVVSNAPDLTLGSPGQGRHPGLNGHVVRVPRSRQQTDAPVRVSRAFRTVAYAAVVSTYLLIVMGAIVRASGSGLGCPDWPLCHGQLVPPGHAPAVIEYSHRLLGGITSLLILSSVVFWGRTWGWRPTVLAGGGTILGLLGIQVILGAIVVKLELPPSIVMIHLGMAMLLLGLLIGVAALASPRPSISSAGPALEERQHERFTRVTMGAAAAVFVLILTGAYVRASGASWACAGFPTCNGDLLPFGIDRLIDIQLLHRLMAFAVGAHLIVTIVRAWRSERKIPLIPQLAALVGVCLVAQVSIGATAVSSGVPPFTQVLHVGGAAALWSSTAMLLAAALRARASLARAR